MAASRSATSGTQTLTTNVSSPATNQQSSTASASRNAAVTSSVSALSFMNTPIRAFIA